jgi:hypothetical protein
MIAASGYAQSPGTFTATGSMTTARFFHTATLLADGRVLITGGQFGSPYESLASAELYDPSTGVFTPTGDMTTARSSHSAALLPDGRVLITGGNGAGTPVATTELYDPSTGTFTGNSVTTTGGIEAVLKNGGVLIAGNTAQLYDPVTNSIAFTGPYIGPFYNGPYFYPDSSILLPDGRVLVVGSACGDCWWFEHEEVYNPVTGTFKVVVKPPTFGDGIGLGHTTTLLTNGKVLLAGGTIIVGDEDFGAFSIAKLFDPSTDTFTATANMTMARATHTATLLPDGTVLIAGGQSETCAGNSCRARSTLASTESYNPFTGQFAATGSMAMARALHTATLLADGRVLMTGGVLGPAPLARAEVYTPPVLVPAPALFSLMGDRKGQGAVWHAQTGQIASAGNPAVAGEILSMYTTSLAEGGAVPPQVAIGGKLAEILFFGDAPGYPGYFQVNFRVPNSVAPGSAILVRLTYFARPSNVVTIGLQ